MLFFLAEASVKSGRACAVFLIVIECFAKSLIVHYLSLTEEAERSNYIRIVKQP